MQRILLKARRVAPMAIVMATAIACLLTLRSCLSCEPTRIARIDVGHNRSVSIYAETCWEIHRSIRYDVWEGRKQIVSKEYLASDLGDSRYTTSKVVFAENGSLVGVFISFSTQSIILPSESYVFVDFKTGDVWPQSMKGYDEAKQKAIDMFDRLQRENSGLTKPEDLSN
jgi:hypothetical protein